MKHYDSKGIPLINTGGGAAGGGVALSAGTQSVSTGTVKFADSNGISFGMSLSSQVTASYTVPSTAGLISAVNFSGGTTSSNLTQLKFGDSNGVSFGLQTGSVLTATVKTDYQSSNANYLTSQSNQAASNSAGSFTFQTLNFSNANNVTFGTSAGGIITASVAATAGLISAVNFSGGTTSSNLTQLKFADSNGVSFGLQTGSVLTATVKTDYQSSNANYLTSQSNQAVSNSAGSFTFQTLNFSNANNVTWGTSAGGIVTASVAAGAAATAISSIAASNTTYTSGGVTFTGSNLVTVRSTTGQGVVMDAQVAASNSLGSFTFQTLNFSNANNVTWGTSAGGIITASVAAPGAAAENNWFNLTGNTAGNTTASGSTIALSGGNNITLSGTNGSVIRIDGAGPFTLSTYEPKAAMGAASTTGGLQTATSGSVVLYPFVIAEYVSAGCYNLGMSMSFVTVGTSSGRQTAGFHVGLYTRGTGASTSAIFSLKTQSVEWSITGNNSSYTINQITDTQYSGFGATGATNSAGVNITSGYTGGKLFAIPLNTLLSPGNYWFGILATKSTSSINVGISLSTYGPTEATVFSALAPMGSFSSAYDPAGTRATDPFGGKWYPGLGFWTSAGSVTKLPDSIAFTSISGGKDGGPFLKFWST